MNFLEQIGKTMPKDITKIIAQMQKAHDYYGKAKGVYDKIDKVYKATKIAVNDWESVRELFGSGYKAKEIKKLIGILDKRASIAEQAAKASFPEVKSDTTKMWVHWADQADKYGIDSPEALKARKYYLKMLLKYDLALRERSTYCEILVKTSEKQIKLYTELAKYVTTIMSVCEDLMAIPEFLESKHHSEAFNMHFNLTGMAPSARKIVKAHKKLVLVAKAEQKRVDKIKKVNDIYISDIRKKDLSNFLKSAMKSFGFAA